MWMNCLRALALMCTCLPLCSVPARAEEIGVVLIGSPDGFFHSLENGIRRAAKDLGVSILVRNPSERTILDGQTNLQLKVIDYMLEQKVSSIILAPEPLKGLSAPVSLPVPLVLADRDGPQFKSQSVVSTDNYAAGRAAALNLAPLVPKDANVMMVRLAPDTLSTMQREEGFLSVAREKGWTVKSDLFVGFRPREVQDRISKALSEHQGRLDAVFTPNESVAIEAVQIISRWPAKTRPVLTAFDWNPMYRRALEDGVLAFTVVQDPMTMGYRSLEIALAASLGKEVPARVNIDVTVVTRMTMDTPAARALAANYEDR